MATGLIIPGADYSTENVGTVGPYTAVSGLDGLFDLRISHDWARYNHADAGKRPCLLTRPNPPVFTTGHMQTTAVGQMFFPDGPLHNADNTMFGIFEAHRTGGVLGQAPLGLSISGTPAQRGQFIFGNGPNNLRIFTFTKTDPNNFSVFGTQRSVTYVYPTNGSLDNQMIFAACVLRNGAGIDLYIPGVNNAAPVATLALTAADRFYFGNDALAVNVNDVRYRASASVGSTERTRCFGYARRALSLTEINQLHTDLRAYYTPKSLPFI